LSEPNNTPRDDKEELFDQYGFSRETGADSTPDFSSFIQETHGVTRNADGARSSASSVMDEATKLSAAEAARKIFEEEVVEQSRPTTIRSDGTTVSSAAAEEPAAAADPASPDETLSKKASDDPSPFREAPPVGSQPEDPASQKGADAGQGVPGPDQESEEEYVTPPTGRFHKPVQPQGAVLAEDKREVLPDSVKAPRRKQQEDDDYWAKMDRLLNNFDDGEVHAGVSRHHYGAVSRNPVEAEPQSREPVESEPESAPRPSKAERAGSSYFMTPKEPRNRTTASRPEPETRKIPEPEEPTEELTGRAARKARKKAKKAEKKANKKHGILPARGDSAGEVIRKLIVILSALVLIGCAVYFAYSFYMAHQNANTTTTLSNLLDEGQSKENEDWEAVYAKYPDVDFPEGMQIKFADIYAMNQDLVGWVTIDGLDIDFPIVQAEDDSYYLRRNFNGQYSIYGTPFLSAENTSTGLDENMVVYGHSMQRDDQMFTPLKVYKEVDGFKEHPLIKYSTLYEDYIYKVYAVFITNGNKSGDNGYLFNYAFDNLATEDDFDGYIKQVNERRLYSTGVDIEWEDKMLILSTCTYEFDDARLVIVGRLLRDGESTDVDTSKAEVNENPRYPQAWYDANGMTNPYVDADQWIPIVKV